MGVDGGHSGLCAVLSGIAADAPEADRAAALSDGRLAGDARLRADLGAGGDPGRDLSWPALRLDLRHIDVGLHPRRRCRAMGDRRIARYYRQLRTGLFDRDRLLPDLRGRDLARRATPGAGSRRAD